MMWRSLSAILVASLALATCHSPSQASAPSLVGTWDVDYTLGGVSRALRFTAEPDGKGTFTLRDARSDLVAGVVPTPATWKDLGSRLRIAGDVEYPIGNVGRETGTLVLTGPLAAADRLSGDSAFFPPDRDPADASAVPSKTGTFVATRVR
jgi:hypothetical protein